MENQQIIIRPLPKQYEAYQALASKDQVFLGGGAGGGKSWWLCESRLVKALAYPGYKSFIGREELKRLMGSTFETFRKVCAHHKVPPTAWKLNGQYNYIEFYNGSRIDLLDLKYLPSDPFYERFGSLEYTDGAIEEAGEVDFRAYDILKSRIGRHLNDKYNIRPTLAITGNPKKNWTYKYFYRPWKDGLLPENYAFIQSLYDDNSYTSTMYGNQLSQLSDPVSIQRLKYGNWEYDDTAGQLMQYDAIMDLFSNTVKDSRNKYMSVDVARYGQDSTVIMVWEGLKCTRMEQYKKQGIDATAARVKELARLEKIPYSHIIVDDDGVGGGVTDLCRGVKGFHGNGRPLEVIATHPDLRKQNYINLKAQCTFMLAEKVNSHYIAIPCLTDEQQKILLEELEAVRQKDPDKDGKLALIPKEEMKLQLGRSPDLADALMMRMYFELNPAVEITEEEEYMHAVIEQTFDRFNPI